MTCFCFCNMTNCNTLAYLLQMSKLFKNCFSAFLMVFAKSAFFCGAFKRLCAFVKYTRPIVAYARCSSSLLFSSTAVPIDFFYSKFYT